MKRKGSRFERELLNLFWESGFAAIRVAGSGSSSNPSPDLVAGNGKKFYAVEVKMRKNLPLYISGELPNTYGNWPPHLTLGDNKNKAHPHHVHGTPLECLYLLKPLLLRH